MGEIKTKVNNADVDEFINLIDNEKKRKDSFDLLEIFKEMTSESPKMWGTSIIGFGQYHYKSEKSRQEGDWMLTGFSPRKQSLTIYLIDGLDEYSLLLQKLGKHKASSGSCLYINQLADIDQSVLRKIIKTSYLTMKIKHNK